MENIKLKVTSSDTLINFLRENLTNKSKNNIKTMIVNNQIYVNNKVQNKILYNLNKNDFVEIRPYRSKNKENNINILYEDEDIIVVDKPYGLLSISTDKEKEHTMYHMVSKYVKEKNKNNKIFVIHRLDKDTSGIILFAKSEKIKNLFQNNWNEDIIERRYYAVVHGTISKGDYQIKSYLVENNNFVTCSTPNKHIGKLAITNYSVIRNNNKYSLLDVDIKTGRKNQIRVHLSENKHPIVGDKKYGKDEKNYKRLYLHAYKIKFVDPRTNKIIEFKTNMPKEFKSMI